MSTFISDCTICIFVIITYTIVIFLINYVHSVFCGLDCNLSLLQLIDKQALEYAWFIKLVINCLGYGSIFACGFLIYKYVNKTKYLEKNGQSFIFKTVKQCFTSSEHSTAENLTKTHCTKSTKKDIFILLYCFSGLMISYLTWGVLQEKIMTQEYKNPDGKSSHFKDSQFLVFINRLLAIVIAFLYILVKRSILTGKEAPLYKYSFASFSNIMSTWFQYEALKFVNFPTQVLAKSCKIIPVMLMGKIIFRHKYEFYEYITAVLISIGMIFFLTSGSEKNKTSSITTITGLFLLMLYMIFDSFTSNWQSQIFEIYKISSVQMMYGVNMFSILFTTVSLALQGGFFENIEFAMIHPKFILDCIILSISSAIGQLFIFYTISVFGPVVFTIIMTLRQAVAILLSCLIYKHGITFIGGLGIFLVFIAIYLRVYCNQRLKELRAKSEENKLRLNV